MPPKYRKRFVLLLLALVISSAAFQTVQACVCPDGDDLTLGKFKSARFVVVNKIVSVHKEPKIQIVFNGGEVTREPLMVITSVKMIVEDVYKGDLKAGDEKIFGQGESSCLMEFREEGVGTRTTCLPSWRRESRNGLTERLRIYSKQ